VLHVGEVYHHSTSATPIRSSSPVEVIRAVPSFHRNYVLTGKLGKGAFAQVYAVRRAGSNAVTGALAVKIMDLRADRSIKPRSHTEEVDTRRKQAVLAESAILRRVADLKHCVQMSDCFVEGCFSYIVMGRCDRTLLQTLEGMPMLNENSVKPIFREMMEALAAIHALGVVHRDVKPDNFLCTGDPASVKLCDFGLASVLPASGEGMLSGVYGTPPFMSPEMLCANRYDSPTDVWSLGVIYYVIVLGHFPYKPAEASGKAMKAAIKAGTPEPTFKYKPRLEPSGCVSASRTLTALLVDLLVRDPQRRPSAATALRKPWLREQVACDVEGGLTSLRPMLYAARRAGAFDPPRNDKEVDKTGMDSVMSELQAEHHSNCASPAKAKSTRVPPSSASTDTGSMGASDRSGQSSLEFQAPGAVS